MFTTRWRRIGIVGSAAVLAVPLMAVPAPASTATVVDVGSTISLDWNGTTGPGQAVAVNGGWVVGWASVTEGQRAFAADLTESPPRLVALGTLGGAGSYAADVSGSWVVGGADDSSNTYHAFAGDLSAETPQLIDLNPDGMVWSYAAAVDGQWAVGEMDSATEDKWWGAAWDLTGATAATPPAPITLEPLAGDPYAWAQYVSGDWVVGISSNKEGSVYRYVAWSLTGATTATPVAAVELPPLTGEEASVFGLQGHWAVGRSRDSSINDLPVVWDLDQASPTPTVLPLTGPAGDALAVDGDLVVGYEGISGTDATLPVVWDLSTEPPTETVLPTFSGPDYVNGVARAIDGTWVVGSSRYGAPDEQTHAFAYNLATEGPLLDLGALNDFSNAVAVDGTWVAGWSSVIPDISHPATWNLLTPARPALADPVAGDGTVSLTWAAPGYTAGASVTGYTVAYKADGDTSWMTTSPTPATGTSLTVDSLTNGTTYQFKVRTSTTGGDSSYSAVTSATPVAPATVPAAPGAPLASRGKTGVSLSWTDNDTGGAVIADHKVKVYLYAKATKRNPATYTLMDTITTGSSSTAYTVTGLTNGKTYVFTVSAGNSVGFSTFSAYSNVARG